MEYSPEVVPGRRSTGNPGDCFIIAEERENWHLGRRFVYAVRMHTLLNGVEIMCSVICSDWRNCGQLYYNSKKFAELCNERRKITLP